MKREIAIVLAAGLLMAGVSAASASTTSQPAKALQPQATQNAKREKIPGARNGMVAELHQSHSSSGKYAQAPATKHS